MNMKSFNLNPERPDVLRNKRRYGFWYGTVLGLSFSVFSWGIDGSLLNAHHGMYPWLKFIVGMIICTLVGGLAGWLSSKTNKPLFSMIIWLVTASVFAWLTVNLPILIFPRLLSIIEPQTSRLLNYVYYEGFGARVGVSYTWLAIFIALAGLLQIPSSDSAVFSTSLFGKAGPILVVIVLTAIGGTMVDNGLINEPLRSSVISTDNTIQFILDNRGKEVDNAEARKMHTGAFRAVEDSVTVQRELIVRSYDDLLGDLNILIHFEKDWVECQVLYSQPNRCKVLDDIP